MVRCLSRVLPLARSKGLAHAILCWSVLWSACGASGQYGFARYYAPTSDEAHYYQGELAATYDEVRSARPEAYADATIGWFGVVQEREDLENGETRLILQFRAHQERHLCENQDDSSCRVTVSAINRGGFVTTLTLRPEDRTGPRQVSVGSLLKIYGRPTGDTLGEASGPIFQTEYYRHWPRNFYVTTRSQSGMRQ